MIFAILFVLLLGVIFIFLLGLLICPSYLDAHNIDNKIDFDSVKKFYPINPDKWRLYEGSVIYGGTTEFRFNFIDYWHYRIWRKQQKRMQKTIAQNDALSSVIKDVKADIAKFEAENKVYIQSKLDELRL